jgi:hypothetical protein
MTLGAGMRAVAIAIAVAGIIDPSTSWSHHEKPVVSVVAASAGDRDLTDRAAQALDRQFTVVRGPDAGAAAIVAVGDRVPDGLDPGSTPAFAVRSTSSVAIEAVDVPERANLDSRVPIAFRARVDAASAGLEATLRVNGLVVDRQTFNPKSGEPIVTGALAFAPTAAGLTRLRVEIASSAGRAAVDAATDVQAERFRVLSYDPRPSYASTFVRRALEGDRRFVVTSRVSTAPRAATATGQPPTSLGASLDTYDAIVVGAPDALTAADVGQLASFAERGGSVCLVMDRVATGPYERLTGATGWTSRESPTLVHVESGSARLGQLHAQELALPSLDPAAVPVASAGDRAVVWSAPFGSGRVVTSGALDAWRQRGVDGSDFERFWQTIVADAAEAARKPIDVRLGSRLFSPRQPITLRVSIGDPGSATSSVTRAAARIEGPASGEQIRLWPDRPGVFTGTGVAPGTPGMYHATIVAAIGAELDRTLTADFLVADDVARGDAREMLSAWASAHGGLTIGADRLDTLAGAIARLVQPPVQVARVFPMRSAWWLPLFALGLAVEWWLRRRRGLA